MRASVVSVIRLLFGCIVGIAVLRSPAPARPLPPQSGDGASDSLVFLEKQRLIVHCSTMTDRALTLARSFMGLPYVTGTLDVNPTEQLVINFRQLDCWTLVENCTAIALTGAQGSYADYRKHLRQLRYWGGNINGYGSRQHYFTGWVLQAEKNGILEDLTKSMGGVPLQKQFHFISSHRARYPKINTPTLAKTIADMEARLSRHPWHYIPKRKIGTMEHLIREGDLILLTSSKAGLDLAHEGFAVRRGKHIHLLHASSIGKRVLISGQPLATYILGQKGMSGIMVLRLRG